MSRELFVLESPNCTRHPCRLSLEPRGYDDLSYAGRHLWKFEKTVHDAPHTALGRILVARRFVCPTN